MLNARAKVAVVLLLTPLLSGAAQHEDYAAPYRILERANRELDPALAASAYAAGGRLIFEQSGQPIEMFQGIDEIRQAYVRTFGQVDAGAPIKLAFRFEAPGLVSDRQSGAYRLTATVKGKPLTLYGRFSVRLVKEQGTWRFAEDRGSVAAQTDFERLPELPGSPENS
jgi:hypothetical protein